MKRRANESDLNICMVEYDNTRSYIALEMKAFHAFNSGKWCLCDMYSLQKLGFNYVAPTILY